MYCKKRKRLRKKSYQPSAYRAVQAMLKVMAQQQSGNSASQRSGQDPVTEFLVTGRTGRRNALPDILGPHAHTSIGDLPERLQSLCSVDSNSAAGPSNSQPPGENRDVTSQQQTASES